MCVVVQDPELVLGDSNGVPGGISILGILTGAFRIYGDYYEPLFSVRDLWEMVFFSPS